MTQTLLVRIAGLKTTPTADLKSQWRELFGTEPPPYSRTYLQSRLAYRIQELSLGGLKPQTIARLEALERRWMAARQTGARSRPRAG